MFERRLKILFGILACFIAILIVRAGQLQILEGESWQKKADSSLIRSSYPKTIRGRILDYRKRELAVDAPCIDAAVDYRAIVKNERWMRDQAQNRLQGYNLEYKTADKDARRKLIDEETARVSRDIDAMFQVLALESDQTPEQIEEIRQSILRGVEMRRRSIWYQRYEKAVDKHETRKTQDDPWYRDFLLSDNPTPQIDNFDIEVAEQTESHVILSTISDDTHNRLKKKIEQYPGLVLVPSVHRIYPYENTACHILGTLSIVTKEDRGKDPWLKDPQRQRLPNDLIGRWGVESLCDETLRGVRGKIEVNTLDNQILQQIAPVPGKDVQLTIDIELQRQIEKAFLKVPWRDSQHNYGETPMYGAAIVTDIKTGQLRAMVSYPTFNLNTYAQESARLLTDSINRPLLNRATQAALEPGSTVKPIVALGAYVHNKLQLHECIECKGHLVIGGVKQTAGRCWTTSTYGNDANHENTPWNAVHANGQLDVVDAIQRSCNVFFENLGHRLKLEGLSNVYADFGLGKPVGIGLRERSGMLPNQFKGSDSEKRSAAWFSAIGQTGILATPLQMAAAHAAIARDGLYIRPSLVMDGLPENAIPASAPRNLNLPPEIIRAVKEGMWKVVNSDAGSGRGVQVPGISIAGKTGTAQARKFSYKDANGEKKDLIPSTPNNINPDNPWYRTTDTVNMKTSHAWFVGFAPYDNPKIAFAVMVEYGGGGGNEAAYIAKAIVEACRLHGYL